MPLSAIAKIDSAVAIPGGYGASSGNIGEPNDLYSIVASTIVANVTPISIGDMSSGQPIITGIPIVRSMQFADAKVAPEVAV